MDPRSGHHVIDLPLGRYIYICASCITMSVRESGQGTILTQQYYIY